MKLKFYGDIRVFEQQMQGGTCEFNDKKKNNPGVVQ